MNLKCKLLGHKPDLDAIRVEDPHLIKIWDKSKECFKATCIQCNQEIEGKILKDKEGLKLSWNLKQS